MQSKFCNSSINIIITYKLKFPCETNFTNFVYWLSLQRKTWYYYSSIYAGIYSLLYHVRIIVTAGIDCIEITLRGDHNDQWESKSSKKQWLHIILDVMVLLQCCLVVLVLFLRRNMRICTKVAPLNPQLTVALVIIFIRRWAIVRGKLENSKLPPTRNNTGVGHTLTPTSSTGIEITSPTTENFPQQGHKLHYHALCVVCDNMFVKPTRKSM